MRQAPDHRYRAVQQAVRLGTAPTEPRMAALYAVLSGSLVPCSLPDVEYALDLYQEEDHRAAVDAFLVTKCPWATITEVLEITVSAVEVYAFLFMDITVFRNRLELITFTTRYAGTAYGKDLVKTALQVGSDYLHWAFNKPLSAVDPRHIVNKVMCDSFYRGMAHRGNSLTSGVTKEAHRWWASAIKNAELSEHLSPTTDKLAREELRIALAQNDETVGPDDFIVPTAEILH